jgi:hypothetical protein
MSVNITKHDSLFGRVILLNTQHGVSTDTLLGSQQLAAIRCGQAVSVFVQGVKYDL